MIPRFKPKSDVVYEIVLLDRRPANPEKFGKGGKGLDGVSLQAAPITFLKVDGIEMVAFIKSLSFHAILEVGKTKRVVRRYMPDIKQEVWQECC